MAKIDVNNKPLEFEGFKLEAGLQGMENRKLLKGDNDE